MREHAFTHDAPTPGKVLFRTDRRVRIWLQTVSHGQLMLSSVETHEPTRLDLLFKVVDQQCIRSSYDGLVVRFPFPEEDFPADAFVLESADLRDHVCARSFFWQEDEQTDFGPKSMAAQMGPLPFEPLWHTGNAFPDWTPSGPVLPLGALIGAVTNDSPQPTGFRHVHAVVVRTNTGTRSITAPVAVYLTRAEAEQAIRSDIAAKADIVAHAAEPGARIQDTLVAKSLANTTIDRWIVPVPIRL